LDEINRVSAQTQFNGVRVLAQNGALTIQVGANDSETIDVNLQQINATTLGLGDFSVRSTVLEADLAAPAAADLQDDDSQTPANFTANVTKADGTDYAAADILEDTGGNYYVKDSDGSYRSATFTITTGTAGDGSDSSFSLTVGEKVTNIVTDAADVVTKTTSPLAALDSALQKVDSLRSDLGAIQNRFESTIANLNNTVNNLSAARSRIEDADYAVEVSNMTRAQILQQAGTAVLAQANQVPQTMLSLLR